MVGEEQLEIKKSLNDNEKREERKKLVCEKKTMTSTAIFHVA